MFSPDKYLCVRLMQACVGVSPQPPGGGGTQTVPSTWTCPLNTYNAQYVTNHHTLHLTLT